MAKTEETTKTKRRLIESRILYAIKHNFFVDAPRWSHHKTECLYECELAGIRLPGAALARLDAETFAD